MNQDPILHAISLRFQRCMLFVVLALGLWLTLWIVLLIRGYDLRGTDLLHATRIAFDPDGDMTIALLCWGCGVISGLAVMVLYLLVALWWRARGDVHRRGTRFIDARDGQD